MTVTTKLEALKLLQDNNCLQHNCTHPAWKVVMKFYKENTGKRADQCCDSCHNQCLQWLRS